MKRFTAMVLWLASFLIAACKGSGDAPVPATPADPDAMLREVFQQLVEINTSPSGSTTVAAEAMAARLRAAGLPDADIQVLGPRPERGNLVARLRGNGRARPMMLLGHLDVVEARREDWSYDPFKLNEVDGYFYGRGTLDDKAMCAIWIATIIRYKQEGWTPDRDIIVALTAAEEEGAGPDNGAEWLLAKHPDLVNAEFVLNEGGGGQIKNGKYIANSVQASEKVYQTYRFEVHNPGGHSSRPGKDNAIYRLADGLARLARYDFPVALNEVTAAYFKQMAKIEKGQLAADMQAITDPHPPSAAIERLSASPYYNALLRTTCVATQLEAGHAENALPQTANATVNCRVLPGMPVDEVLGTLVRIVADKEIAITPVEEAVTSPPSPLNPAIFDPIGTLTEKLWPGVPVLPVMSTGATDGIFYRKAGIPVYGVSGVFVDIDDNRAHGKDERVGVRQLYEGREFLHGLVRALAAPSS
jgi:acetylornithine deacetylase/succinyl-diaminopimelate desuccinylase-like protein